MRVLLRGPFNVFTGYGNDLVGLASALTRQGVDVVPLPTSVMAGLPPEVANLFTKDPSGRYDVCLMHQPPFDLNPPENVREMSHRVVGWTMWEQDVLTKDDMKGHGCGRWPWRKIDHIMCYDPVSKQALDAFNPKVSKTILQGGVDAPYWPYNKNRSWSGTFKFAMLGELHQRKDPFLAIDAYRELREEGELEDSELHLKSSIPGLHPGIEEWIPGVRVYYGFWQRERTREFLSEVHCLLAPSRGEGKNLPALEIQLTGGVVIATNWGGHQVWLHPDYAFPLEYDLLPIGPGHPARHARARKDHLKTLMVKAYSDRALCRRMGETASSAIRTLCSWDAVGESAVRQLAALL